LLYRECSCSVALQGVQLLPLVLTCHETQVQNTSAIHSLEPLIKRSLKHEHLCNNKLIQGPL